MGRAWSNGEHDLVLNTMPPTALFHNFHFGSLALPLFCFRTRCAIVCPPLISSCFCFLSLFASKASTSHTESLALRPKLTTGRRCRQVSLSPSHFLFRERERKRVCLSLCVSQTASTMVIFFCANAIVIRHASHEVGEFREIDVCGWRCDAMSRTHALCNRNILLAISPN